MISDADASLLQLDLLSVPPLYFTSASVEGACGSFAFSAARAAIYALRSIHAGIGGATIPHRSDLSI
jgi:hypothetical protein